MSCSKTHLQWIAYNEIQSSKDRLHRQRIAVDTFIGRNSEKIFRFIGTWACTHTHIRTLERYAKPISWNSISFQNHLISTIPPPSCSDSVHNYTFNSIDSPAPTQKSPIQKVSVYQFGNEVGFFSSRNLRSYLSESSKSCAKSMWPVGWGGLRSFWWVEMKCLWRVGSVCAN